MMTDDKTCSRSSLRNNIVITFLIVIITGGVIINMIMHTVFPRHLSEAGWDNLVIEYVDKELALYGTGATMLGIIAVLFVGFSLSNTITKPLKKIINGMKDMAEGRFSTRINISSNDEFGRLAEGFNNMASHIEDIMKELKVSMDFTESILRSVPSILVVVNSDMKVLSYNSAFDKLSSQYPSIQIDNFIHMLKNEVRATIESGNISRREISIKPSGSEVTIIFSVMISPLNNYDDGVTGQSDALLTISDITERKKMKELVMQSRQDWEDTFNTIPDMITIHDKDYNIVMANRAAKESLHLPDLLNEIPNKCFKYYHGTEAPPEGCPSCNCYRTERPATFEIFEPNLDKYIEIRSIPRKNRYDELIGLIHIVRDITERKKVEQEHMDLMNAVTRAKIEWEHTFDSTMEQIVIVDSSLNIIRSNHSFADFAGKRVSEIIGKQWHGFFPESKAVDDIRNSIEKGFKEPIKTEIEAGDGKWLLLNVNPVREELYESRSYVIVIIDITDIKDIQEKLAESEKELKKKVMELERFFDMAVGRELKMKSLKMEVKKLHLKLNQADTFKAAGK